MSDFTTGMKIPLEDGSWATVLEELGDGGEGIVYKVNWNGKEKALKYYYEVKTAEFKSNLQNNIERGAPDEMFVWPEVLTKQDEDGRFGYLMEFVPGEYKQFTRMLRGKVRFASYETLIKAAINLVQAFRILHNKGFSYADINDGNIFINFDTGDVRIIDNDNVVEEGDHTGMGGKPRYMAPEIVLGQNPPDKYSDRFSLSVMLFRLFFYEHPLEGAYSTPPCMTPPLAKKYYGEEPVYIMDPVDKRNRPIKGTVRNLKIMWGVYPTELKDMFARCFSYEVLHDRYKRVIEKTWLDLLFDLLGRIVTCPLCKEQTFAKKGYVICTECERDFSVKNELVLGRVEIPLIPGAHVMLHHINPENEDMDTKIGEVVPNRNDPDLIGIKNISDSPWFVKLSDGSVRKVTRDKAVPVMNGIKEIQFNGTDSTKGYFR